MLAIALKPFQFRLQSVLEYRQEQLDQIQLAVGKEEQVRVRILQQIQEADQLIETVLSNQQHAVQSGEALDMVQLQSFPHYLWRLKQDRFQHYTTLQQQEARLAVMREELKQAHIRTKALETLRDKDKQQYKKTIDKAEEHILEEIALQQRIRRAAQSVSSTSQGCL